MLLVPAPIPLCNNMGLNNILCISILRILSCYTCKFGDKCNMFLSDHTRSSQNDPFSSSDSSGCITSHIVMNSIVFIFLHLFKSAVFAFVYFYKASCQVFIRDSSVVHTTETPVTVFSHIGSTIVLVRIFRYCLALLIFLVGLCGAFSRPISSVLVCPCYHPSPNVISHQVSIGSLLWSLYMFSSDTRNSAFAWLKLLPSTSIFMLE